MFNFFESLKCIGYNLHLKRNGREKSEVSLGSHVYCKSLAIRMWKGMKMTKVSQVSWKSYSGEVQASMMHSLSKVLFELRPLTWIFLFFIYNILFVPDKIYIFFNFQKLYCKLFCITTAIWAQPSVSNDCNSVIRGSK